MKPLLLTWWLICGADATTTHMGMARGYEERWLPASNPWVVDGMVAGQAALGTFAVRRLNRTHPRAARVLGWTLVGVRMFAVVHNVGQLR